MIYDIFDIDNCIADDAWRVPFIDWTPGLDANQRYDKYHMHCGGDEARNEGALRCSMATGTPVFFTARPEGVRRTTEHWLFQKFGLVSPLVMMRGAAEFTPSVILKARMLDRFVADLGAGDRIRHAYDDRQDIVDMYIRQGIAATVLKVHDVCAYTNPNTLEKIHG